MKTACQRPEVRHLPGRLGKALGTICSSTTRSSRRARYNGQDSKLVTDEVAPMIVANARAGQAMADAYDSMGGAM